MVMKFGNVGNRQYRVAMRQGASAIRCMHGQRFQIAAIPHWHYHCLQTMIRRGDFGDGIISGEYGADD